LKKAAGKAPLVLSSQSKHGVPEALRALLKVIGRAGAKAETKEAVP
jgi:GTP-binding protein